MFERLKGLFGGRREDGLSLFTPLHATQNNFESTYVRPRPEFSVRILDKCVPCTLQ